MTSKVYPESLRQLSCAEVSAPMLSNPLSPGARVTRVAAGVAAAVVATAVGEGPLAAAGAPVSGSAGTAAETGPAPESITAPANAVPISVERSQPCFSRAELPRPN